MRSWRIVVIAFALLLGWGCGGGSAFLVSLVFPSENDAKNLARQVRVLAIIPGPGASCAALVDGSASAGDAGYEIEDEVSFTMPLSGDPRPLDVQAGRRLFYAEAEDETGEVFVRGCTEAEAGDSGVRTVTINLEWVVKVCQTDADCDDDDPCTIDSCLENECDYGFAPAGTNCDDGLYCTTEDTCDGSGNCGGQQVDCSAFDDQCNRGACNEAAHGCEARPDNEGQGCDDGLFCTTGETCQAGVCSGGAQTDCDDGIGCTLDTCSEADRACRHDADDSLCDDGVGCTIDSCDDQAGCLHTPNAGGCRDYHIGPAPDTCPHDDGSGGQTSACDFTGADGLDNAVAAAPAEGARFYVYDNNGTPAEYVSCELPIPGDSYLGAAPGVDPANVLVSCEWPNPSGASNGVIHLAGDNIHVERLTIILMHDAKTALSAWSAYDDPSDPTGGHLLNNIVAIAIYPELWGWNGIQAPVYLGPDMTVRNCHFYGYFDNELNFAYSDNTRLLNNTMIYYQDCGGEWDLSGTQGVVIANNVVLSLTRTQALLLRADAATTALNVSGNVVEGFDQLLSGQNSGDPSIVVENNHLGEAQLESPLNPLFLADSTQTTGTRVPGEGESLDGVGLDGKVNILPGAYQQRSSLSGPRRMLITVGSGTCGTGPCDIDADTDNEIQAAVWSSWPGGEIDVYPQGSPYAGDAIISWAVSIKGMDADPANVVLQSGEEDSFLSHYLLWQRHGGVLNFLKGIDPGVDVENLTIRVDADAMADERAVTTEGDLDNGPADWHHLRRLIIQSVNSGDGLQQGLYLSNRVEVTNSLIQGAFASCVTYGLRHAGYEATPQTTGRLVNLTCRLDGTGSHAPQSALDVASVVDSVFVNLAIEIPDTADLFRAQRRTSGDNGATALDVPVSFTADSITVSDYRYYSNGFDSADGNYTRANFDKLAPGAPFFVGPADSHLDAACTSALDNGVDPASIDGALSAGISLDGVDRAGRSIDRGCYEQGQ